MSEHKDASFRKKLFGFSKSDVMEYISANAAQWNNLKEGLERKLAGAARKQTDTENALKAAEEKAQALEKKLAEANEENNKNRSLLNELTKGAAAAEMCRQENEALKSANVDLNEALKNANTDFEVQKKALQNDIERFRANLEISCADAEEARQQAAELNEKNKLLEAENASLRNRTEELEKAAAQITALLSGFGAKE